MTKNNGIKLVISTIVFFIVGIVITLSFNVEFPINIAISYLICAIPFSIIRLNKARPQRRDPAFAFGFYIVKWIVNFIFAVITLPYWFIKGIIAMI